MSNFPQNLSILRRRAGYTQESLAEALNISRQAVSKWESGQTMPEAATLLELSDLLGCTLDQLMREELSEKAPPLPEQLPIQEDDGAGIHAAWTGLVDRFALMIAAGVGLILLGLSAMVALSAFVGEEPLATVPFFLCLIVAVYLFVSGGIAHGDFQKSYPKVSDYSDPAERAEFQRRFRVGMSGAIAGVLLDVCLLVVLNTLFPRERAMILSAALFLAILALCVGVMVYLGVLTEKYELERYNAERKGPDISGAIMLTATGVYLLLGFTRNLWHPGWLVFPLAGILCAIVDSLRRK